jgi:hypothetical protein
VAIEMLSYRQLGERFGCSRDVARAWVKQLRLPRHMANDGKVLVSIDLSEINDKPMPSPSPASGQELITKKQTEAKVEGTAGGQQDALERERERAERLMAELLRAKADALTARAMIGQLERELETLRSRSWWRWLTWKKTHRELSTTVTEDVPSPAAG